MSQFVVTCKCGSDNVRVTYQKIKGGAIRGRGQCRVCGKSDNLSQNLSPHEFFLNFGKHNGHTLATVALIDKPYLEWLRDNTRDEGLRLKIVSTLELTPEALLKEADLS